ncbi:hypothetical protein CEK25_012069 [Fusarium fujikuroi]|nr:hypothetical protein CEK25_012069 [Fusarium fujikuroi]
MTTRRSARLMLCRPGARLHTQDDPALICAKQASEREQSSETGKRKAPVIEMHEKTSVINNDGRPATKKDGRAETSPPSTWTIREVLNAVIRSRSTERRKTEDTRKLLCHSCANERIDVSVAYRLSQVIELSEPFLSINPKKIRTQEPVPSSNQRKHPKKKGEYRARQASCLSATQGKNKHRYVEEARKANLEVVDPGSMRNLILLRTVQEHVKNISNLEFSESKRISEPAKCLLPVTWEKASIRPLAKSLAIQKNLKHLAISAGNLGASEAKPISEIKDLKHSVILLLNSATPEVWT